MRWGWLAGAVAMWALLVGIAVVGLYPALPRSARGWLALVVVAPPIYVAVELVAGKLLSREAGLRLTAKRFSWKRVAIALLVCVAVEALVYAALGF